MITLEQVAGWSAFVAAVATAVGAVTLMVFFSKGGLWGLANDIASVVLMLATIPVALVIAAIESEAPAPGLIAWITAVIGIGGMLGAAGFQAALVARVRTYEQLLPWTLGAGSVVGVWYVLVGLLGVVGLGVPLAGFALASGVGFIAIGYGFARGGQRHPLAAIGGVVLLVSSMAFLVGLGWQLVSGTLGVPAWNA